MWTRAPQHATHGADGARHFALKRAGLVDALLEIGEGEAVAAIEDLVSHGAAGGQTLGCEIEARLRHHVRRHQHLRALCREAIGNMVAIELLHDLSGVPQIQVAVEQRHLIGAAGAQRKHRDHGEHRKRDGAEGEEPSRAERL